MQRMHAKRDCWSGDYYLQRKIDLFTGKSRSIYKEKQINLQWRIHSTEAIHSGDNDNAISR